jgi:hypothetical protein
MISTYTDLVIVDVSGTAPGVNPYSARGLRGALRPIDAGQGLDKLARTVNGSLIDISAPQMRKYRLEITGNDQAPPALDGLWVGMLTTVWSHVEVAYLTSGGSPSRTPAPGSVRTEGSYTYYRPTFAMRVVEWQIEREEWDANAPWSLTLEEV